MIETEPPVMGKTYWSVRDIVRTTTESGLPGGKGITALVGVSPALVIDYLLLVVALGMLCLLPTHRLLSWVGAIGASASMQSWRGGRRQFSPVVLRQCGSVLGLG